MPARDSRLWSIYKGMGRRVVGSLDTLPPSHLFTGDVVIAPMGTVTPAAPYDLRGRAGGAVPRRA